MTCPRAIESLHKAGDDHGSLTFYRTSSVWCEETNVLNTVGDSAKRGEAATGSMQNGGVTRKCVGSQCINNMP